MSASAQQGRSAEIETGPGREAERPGEISPRSWREILFRVKDEISEDHLGHIAAGAAFYWILAIVAALGALLSACGLIADPAAPEGEFVNLLRALPEDVGTLLAEQLRSLAAGDRRALSLILIVAVFLTFWSATKGVNALIVALNIAYDEEEKRGFFRLGFTAISLTVGVVGFAAVTLGLVVALPLLLRETPLSESARAAVLALRWPLLGGAMMLALATLYRFGPSRSRPRWRWATWGAAGATIAWLAASICVSRYVASFGDFNGALGSIGAVVLLLLWFWIGAYLVLIGAEVDAERERGAARGTRAGPRARLGRRGAYADEDPRMELG